MSPSTSGGGRFRRRRRPAPHCALPPLVFSLALLALLPLLPSEAGAANRDAERPPSGGTAEAADSVSAADTTSSAAHFEMVTIQVEADPLPPGTVLLRADERPYGGASLAEAIPAIPGVSAVRRSAGGVDPVIRGLGRERVATRVGGVCVSGACPSRMDPPASYFAPSMASEITVVTGIPSVTLGPGGIGGAIEISPDFERPRSAAPALHYRWDESWESAREGLVSGGSLWGGTRDLDFRLSGDWLRRRDYESGAGTLVPADQESRRGEASLGWRPAYGHRVWSAWRGTLEEDVEFPSLPMDLVDSELQLLNAGYRFLGTGYVREFELRGGWSRVDHFMSNENKANRGVLEASTPSESESGALEMRWRFDGPGGAWLAGLQGSYLSRDAIRTRHVLANDKTFRDHLWPDATQETAGGYLETSRSLGARTTVRVGVRGDVTRSAASAADDPGLGGATIRQGYVRFHGDAAADTDRTEGGGSFQLLLRRTLSDGLGLHLGGGVSTRAASVTERYFAFGPAPGGFQVGNPALNSEKKLALEAGISRRGRRLQAHGTLYGHDVRDFILTTVAANLDANGDGTPDVIRSFRNVDARLVGLDATVDWQPTGRLAFPLRIAFTRGWNRADDRDLPEIPPVEGTFGAIVDLEAWLPSLVEVETRFAFAQSFVDPGFAENETPAWATLSLHSETRLGDRIRLRLGIENVLDTVYHEHLTREALLKTGDLLPGEEVPAPGRSFLVALRVAG